MTKEVGRYIVWCILAIGIVVCGIVNPMGTIPCVIGMLIVTVAWC